MKVFLSYPSEQGEIARRIYGFAQTLGIDIWFDKESLIAGQRWERERRVAQSQADLFILLYSTETNEKEGVIRREINAIKEKLRDMPDSSIALVCIRVGDVQIEDDLLVYQYIDFHEYWQTGLAKALRARSDQLGENSENIQNFILSQSGTEAYQAHENVIGGNGWECFAAYLEYNRHGPYFDLINATLAKQSLEILYSGARSIRPIAMNRESEFNLYVNYRQVEFFRDGGLISVRGFYEDYTGGAHGNYGFVSFNFAGEDVGLVDIRYLFDGNSSFLSVVRRIVSLDLQRKFVDEENIATSVYQFLPTGTEELWGTFSEFNFDQAGIVINLGPYSALPYVYGSHNIAISWEYIRGYMAQELRDTTIWNLARR